MKGAQSRKHIHTRTRNNNTHTQHTNKIVKGGPKRCKAAGRMESEGGGGVLLQKTLHIKPQCAKTLQNSISSQAIII